MQPHESPPPPAPSLRRGGAPAALAAALALLPAVQAAAAPAVLPARAGGARFEVLYAGNTTLTVQTRTLEAVRRWAASRGAKDPESVRDLAAFSSGGTFVISDGGGYAGSAPPPRAELLEAGDVELLDAASDALFLPEDGTGSAFGGVERALREAAWGQERRPGTRLKKGRLETWRDDQGRRWRTLSLGSPDPYWSRTVAFEYRYVVDGASVTAVGVARPLGDPARLVTALRKAEAGASAPVLKLGLGGFSDLSNHYLAPERALAPFIDLGFDANGLSLTDATDGWSALESLARQRAEGRKLPVFICSNLAPAEPGRALPCAPSFLAEIGGARVAVLSALNPEDQVTLKARGIPAVIEGSDALQRRVYEARNKDKADIVIMLTGSAYAAEAQLRQSVWGYDALLGREVGMYDSALERTARFKEWGTLAGDTAFEGRVAQHGFSELTLELEPGPDGLVLSSAHERTRAVSVEDAGDPAYGDALASIVRGLTGGDAALLPDAREVWPGRVAFHPYDVRRAAARILRDSAKTEAALVRLEPNLSDTPGTVAEGMVRQWLSPPDRVVRAELTGAELERVLPLIRRPAVPLDLDREDSWAYARQAWFTADGIAPGGLVGGRPLAPAETYSVATTERALATLRALGLVARASAAPLKTTLDELVIGRFKDLHRLPPAEAATALRGMMEGREPVRTLWRLNLERLSLKLQNAQVQNNAPFSQVRDARIQTVDQIYAQASGRLSSELRRGPFQWDAGMSAEYGRVTVKPPGTAPIKNETADRWTADTELRRALMRLEGPRGGPGFSAGPFANARYDSEFTKPVGLDLRRLVRVTAGAKLYDGRPLKSLYAGGVQETDYARGAPNTEYGWAAGGRFGAALPRTAAKLELAADFVSFGPSVLDTADDLKSELETEARLSVPVWGGLELSQFLRYYRFQGKVVPVTGHNLTFGFALDFSFLLKP